MSASAGGSSQDAAVASSRKLEKKHKRTKSDHKKRAREDDEAAVVEETPRKSKKSKKLDVTDGDRDEVQPEQLPDASGKPAEKKKKNKEQDDGGVHDDAAADPETKTERKKSSKRAKDVARPEPEPMDVDEPEVVSKKRRGKKSRNDKVEDDEAAEVDATQAAEVVLEKKKKKRKSKDKVTETLGADDTSHSQEAQATQEPLDELPVGTDYPFFTQTVSLYVPFFPLGFDKPLTNVAAQHLDPLLNHYSPVLRGVLLSYSNLNLSDRPAKASVTHPPTDQTPALLHSIDEYAVGFGWLTFDAQLFVPSRGKWMEGVVQLQSEGHIGVVCWNKFNASIEANRLPAGWKWVDLAKGGPRQNNPLASDDKEAEQEEQSEDMLDGEELQVVEQIHTTGYWVNEGGRKVSGKLRFRIKNFDVGLAGDYGYLSIEGTCLDEDAERTLAAEERQADLARRARQNPAGLLRPLSRRVPEFSMTKFGREDQEEDDGQRTVLYKGSRPGTPDD